MVLASCYDIPAIRRGLNDAIGFRSQIPQSKLYDLSAYKMRKLPGSRHCAVDHIYKHLAPATRNPIKMKRQARKRKLPSHVSEPVFSEAQCDRDLDRFASRVYKT
jgi:hypothetical protein